MLVDKLLIHFFFFGHFRLQFIHKCKCPLIILWVNMLERLGDNFIRVVGSKLSVESKNQNMEW